MAREEPEGKDHLLGKNNKSGQETKRTRKMQETHEIRKKCKPEKARNATKMHRKTQKPHQLTVQKSRVMSQPATSKATGPAEAREWARE